MTYFDKITASLEALGAFLQSIPTMDAPWDELFQRTYCSVCPAENCSLCPHQEKRNNPAWFLAQDITEVGT